MKRPILVTGSHRSGSTWVGKVISEANDVVYVHEPFNIDYSLARYGLNLENWFTYICKENEDIYLNPISNIFNLKSNLGTSIANARSIADLKKILRSYFLFSKSYYSRDRPLVKDPIALFSAEWISLKFSADVVIIIRHPAAFVGSIKLKNWTFPFSHFRNQKLLMRDYLYPFEDKINRFCDEETSILDQAILLWNITHYVILQYQRKYKSWLFLRHEDVSIQPERSFKEIFKCLNLEFSKKVLRTINSTSNPNNSCETSKNIYEVRRNSKLNIWSWKDRLSSEEISRIRNDTYEISKHFYSDKDW